MTKGRSTARVSPKIPDSAALFSLNVGAMVFGLAVLYLMVSGTWSGYGGYVDYPPLLPCLAVFLIIALAERVLRRRGRLKSGEMQSAPLRPIDPRRVAVRMFGLAVTFALVAFAYWLFPEYSGSFYAPYWKFLTALAPLMLLAPAYLTWVDVHAENPRDELVEFADFLLRGLRSENPAAIRRHLMGWTVKAFFLPLMTVYLNNDFNALINYSREGAAVMFGNFDFWFTLSYTIDLLFCVIGYSAALRIFDAQILSVEPTALGWMAALLCYQPFFSVINQFYLPYEGATNYWIWLQHWPTLRDVWGTVITLLLMIYSFSTVAFGLRFSNLTHRGIITSGPYRFSKHPAYLSKNLSWWLVSVPFVATQEVSVALRHCVALLLLNGVYFLRARTEERHLSRDPTYVAYARWMDAHGVFSMLSRRIPWLKFRAPAASPGVDRSFRS
jgi:protein-S-isoprenylcysteine O-methyltransferase Ste14